MKCCVPECKKVSTNGMHVFPADEAISKQWVRFTKTFHLDKSKLKDHRVCEMHFKEADRIIDANGNKCLKPNAIPCLHLPPSLNIKSEHSYNWDSKNRNRPKPRARQYVSKKTLAAAISNAILTNDPTVNNVGNEEEIDHSSREKNQRATPLIDPFIMLEEANQYIKILEDKLQQKTKEKAVLSRKFRINGKKLKKLKVELNNRKKNGIFMSYLRDNNFNKQQIEFLMMQKNVTKKPNGRRYSNYQKSLALAIYKQGPKCYRFLERMFVLPSKTTLGRHSAELIFESGIDPRFFAFVEEKVKNLSPSDTVCTISWDEMSLKPNLQYSLTRDLIDGFVELADKRLPRFATHSLTFMVRGINIAYKQPVAFFYTDGLNKFELVELIKLVTEAVLKTGLNVIGSTCDQVGSNVAAVHILVYNDSRTRTPDGSLLAYEISGRTIIHCYDPPHLIKVLRNNLEKKNLQHFISQRWLVSSSNTIVQKQAKLASWTHVAYLFSHDSQAYHRRLTKITDEHIAPKELKMKVSVATQVLSETYGKVMIDCCEKKELPDEFMDTAQILLFFNDVFDSLNGSNHPEPSTLKGSINKDSDHFAFWEYAIEMLSKMTFVTIETGKINNASTVLKKFEATIRGYAEITRICMNFNITQVSLRNTHQDGLENFFGCVKTCCQNAKAPMAIHFRTGYTTMIMNNITGSNSLSTNCEPDSTIPLLNDLHEFFLNFQENIVEHAHLNSDNDHCSDMLESIIFDPQLTEMGLNVKEHDTPSHISNSICHKLLQTIDCENCRKKIETSDSGAIGPSQDFLKKFEKIFCEINKMIPLICSEKSLRKTMIGHIDDVNIGCLDHDEYVSLKLKELTINYALFSFCKEINSFLSGKNKILPSDASHMQELALEYRSKKKHIGKFTKEE